VDSVQQQKNLLFQNFMNNRLGFNLQARQYLDFMDTCQAHSADTVTTPAGSLPSTVASLFPVDGDNAYRSLSRASDGSFYAVADFAVPGSIYVISKILHIGSNGSPIWTKTFSQPSATVNLEAVKATADGGFITVGAFPPASDPNGQYQLTLIKGDASGNTTWEKTVHLQGALGFEPVDITQTHDGGYAIAVDWNAHLSLSSLPINLVVRTDGSGNVLWTRGVMDNANCESHLNFITEINDTLFLTGTQSTSPTVDNSRLGLMFKMDETTGAIYNTAFLYDFAMVDTAYQHMNLREVFPSATGYRVAAGFTTTTDASRLGMADLDFSGNLRSFHMIGPPVGNDSSSAIFSRAYTGTQDGGWVMGELSSADGHFYWTKFNSDWTVGWSTVLKLPGEQEMDEMVQNPDNSFSVMGEDFDSTKEIVVGLSSVGTVGCYSDSAAPLPLTTPGYITQVSRGLKDSVLPWTYFTETVSTSLAGGSAASSISCIGGPHYVNYNGPLLCGNSAPLLPPVDVTSVTTCSDSTFFSVSMGTALYNTYADSLTGDFEQRYKAKCMQAYKHESFTVTHNENEYHHTLYYYDQAGNLVKTVSPAGARQNTDTNWIKQVETAKAAGQVLVPQHIMVTNYRYNTINQVISKYTPDGGALNFWYDRLSRVALSQNANQRPNNQYTYTQYDTIGRVIQSGQLVSAQAIDDNISRNAGSLLQWETNALPTANQITVTIFDSGSYAIAPQLIQRNTRNRVSWTAYYDTATDLANGSSSSAAATYYTYDILGNVDTLVQDFGGVANLGSIPNLMNSTNNRFKKIAYDFDLVSGKMNKVSYQHGANDAFYHTYLYDAENRIINVQSSTDSINWDNDAFYSYYIHGPMARVVLGQQQVQGINYAYTLQGWVKAINPAPYTGSGFTLRPDSSSNIVANSAYNVLLNYFDGDFKPVSTGGGPDSGVANSMGSDYRPLYNGNISSMGTRVSKINIPILYNFQYDQLNRLVHSDAWNRTANTWNTIVRSSSFQEGISYDPNGNIRQFKRNGDSLIALNMDSLHYCYQAGTNRLDHVTDAVTEHNYTSDIKGQSAGNYQYDSIGELVKDSASGILNVGWNIYGKIVSITRSGDTTLYFTYDAGGNRISKSVVHAGDIQTTWYVRDAQGNILSLYTSGDPAFNGRDLTQNEVDIYGRDHLGIWKRNVDVEKFTPPSSTGIGDSLSFVRGNKLFELTNHLGNVLATISDKRYGVSLDDSTVSYFNPEVVSANDYYPSGMVEPGRSYAENSTGYRFGFNGMEKESELNPDNYTTRFRELDTRINRWWSIDPKGAASPWSSPYVVNGNDPLLLVDPFGDKEYESLKAYHKATGKKQLGPGDWLSSDRKNNTNVWKAANLYNLKQKEGYQEYTNIEQRAAFYDWVQEEEKGRKSDIHWAGAAAQVAYAINNIANPTLFGINAKWAAIHLYYTDEAAIDFGNTGNRMIFEDVFPKLRKLINSPPLKGQDAFNWDAMALSQEQNLIQPLYESTKSFGVISAASKRLLGFSDLLAKIKDIKIPAFPVDQNIGNAENRWAYGMQGMGYKVNPGRMPWPGASYTDGTMYQKFRGKVDPTYWKTK